MPQPREIGSRFLLCLLLHPRAAEQSYIKAVDQDAATQGILEPADLEKEKQARKSGKTDDTTSSKMNSTNCQRQNGASVDAGEDDKIINQRMKETKRRTRNRQGVEDMKTKEASGESAAAAPWLD